MEGNTSILQRTLSKIFCNFCNTTLAQMHTAFICASSALKRRVLSCYSSWGFLHSLTNWLPPTKQAKQGFAKHPMVNTLIQWFAFMVSSCLTIFLGTPDLVICLTILISSVSRLSISEQINKQGGINPKEKANERTR